MIAYHDFRRLWTDAQEISDIDQYIAETGGSIDCEDVEQAVRLLSLIHRLANAPATDIRAAARLTQAGMAREYGIPISTCNKWDGGVNRPIPWTHVLLAYAVVSDMMEDFDEKR